MTVCFEDEAGLGWGRRRDAPGRRAGPVAAVRGAGGGRVGIAGVGVPPARWAAAAVPRN